MKRIYTVKGETVELTVDENTVAVRYGNTAPNSARAAAAEMTPELGGFSDRVELPHEGLVLLPVTGPGRRDDRLSDAMTHMSANNVVEKVLQVFRAGDKKLIVTDLLLMGLQDGSSDKSTMLTKYNLQLIEDLGDGECIVKVALDQDPIDLINIMADDDAIDYVEPDFVTVGKHLSRSPAATGRDSGTIAQRLGSGDPRSSEQYAIHITEAVKAWETATGSPDVRIAILDEGVDTLHTDLSRAIVGSYDAVDNDAWQEPKPWDAHGTACAGLAAAIHGNGAGIKGIGGGCSILAVRIAYSSSPNSRGWVTRNSWIKRAIKWSVNNGADVLSNSWGGGSYSYGIDNEFKRARRVGREGKGAVVVVAAGNASSRVDFPGNLQGVLTVSASNEFDEFKTKTSQDGESWWGSNYGPEVDVAAPGVHNLTTDNRGFSGYNSTNYTDFNGTSSACPIVAGACGLLISVHGDLTEREIKKIIQDNADKVGQFRYDHNGFNSQMGYGRLNVANAVEAVVNLLENRG